MRWTISSVLVAALSAGCAYHSPTAPTTTTPTPSTAAASIRLTAASRADLGLDVVATVLTADGHFVPGTSVAFASTAGTFTSSPVTTDNNGAARTVLAQSGTAIVTASAGTLQTSVTVQGTTVPTSPSGNPPEPPAPTPTPTPTATLNVSTSGTVGTAMSFAVSAPAGFTWTWAFGDGVTAQTTTYTTTHTYTTAGTYAATVSAAGVNAGHATIAVANAAPVPGPPPPTTPSLALTVTCASFVHGGLTSCNITAHDETGALVAPGSVTAASWDFGDGQTASTHPLAQNTYAQPGTYVVVVSATGPGGRTGTVSTTLTIT